MNYRVHTLFIKACGNIIIRWKENMICFIFYLNGVCYFGDLCLELKRGRLSLLRGAALAPPLPPRVDTTVSADHKKYYMTNLIEQLKKGTNKNKRGSGQYEHNSLKNWTCPKNFFTLKSSVMFLTFKPLMKLL